MDGKQQDADRFIDVIAAHLARLDLKSKLSSVPDAPCNNVVAFTRKRTGKARSSPPAREAAKLADLELLARMAARLAGRDPDEHVIIKLAGLTAFEGMMWRYPDFLGRAQEAYDMLMGPTKPAV